MSSYPAPPLTPIPAIVPRRQTIASPRYTPKYFSTPKQVQFDESTIIDKENTIPYSPLLKISSLKPGSPSYATVVKEGYNALNTPTIAANKNLNKTFEEIERFSLFEEGYNDKHNNFYPSSLFIKKLDAIDAKAQSEEEERLEAPATPSADTPRRNSIRAGGAQRVKVTRQSATTPTRMPQTPKTPSRLSLGQQPRSAISRPTASSSAKAIPTTPTAPRNYQANRTPTATRSSRTSSHKQPNKTPQSNIPPPRTPTSRQSIANPIGYRVPPAPSSVAAINYKKVSEVTVATTQAAKPEQSVAQATTTPVTGKTRVFCTPAKKILNQTAPASSTNNNATPATSSNSLSSHPFITYLAQTRATYMTPRASSAVYTAISSSKSKSKSTPQQQTDYLPSSPTVNSLPRQDSAKRRLAFEN